MFRIKILLKLLRNASFLGLVFGFSVCATDVVEERGDPFALVPTEITTKVLSYLEPGDIGRASLVCSQWHEILEGLHGPSADLSAHLYDTSPAAQKREIAQEILTLTMAQNLEKKGFVPLEHVCAGASAYPEGARLLSAKDLQGDEGIVASWRASLFGAKAPKDEAPLSCVLAALPQILVQDTVSEKTLLAVGAYVAKLGNSVPHLYFSGSDKTQDEEALSAHAHAIVVRAGNFKAHKERLNTLLATRNDHTVVLALDDDTFVQTDGLTMSKDDLPVNLHHLVLADPHGKITAIGWDFLQSSQSLRSLSTKGLTSVTHISDEFLVDCKHLLSIDTRGLQNVTDIGNCFMYGDTRLKSLDTRGFQKVKTIDFSFLGECIALESIHTGGLSNVEIIPENFMGQCSALRSFDTKALGDVEIISHLFLHECFSLRSFDPEPLKSIKRAGWQFLEHSGLSKEAWGKVNAFLDRTPRLEAL
ncbi:MAG: hypothetical protein C0514_00150 [Candidatus Puniceispirillum sp.]|nr:hypothetical protein [Candidatus Puniceispirillum sp.]